MLSWDRMRVFSAVAEHGSVSRAAASLHLTGPGVSQHIRRLEREVGATLVERNGRTIRLTPAGRALAAHAAAMSASARLGESDVARIDTEVAGALRIGAVASALRRLVVPALAELTSAYPEVAPTIVDGEAHELLDSLERRALDAVVFESWDNQPTRLPCGVHAATLVTEKTHVAVPVGSRRTAAALSELTTGAWAVCPAGSAAHDALLQLFREAGHEPRVAFEVSDYTTQLALVEVGLAVALIPETARDPDASVTYLAVEPSITRSLRFATSTDIPAVRELERLLTTTLRSDSAISLRESQAPI
ncbi:LysR family transcriptional regulator [Rhodococcus sp. NBC_00297]|uniref:LysR family transcriptional regulator n=1 Tax=Rhodococcus sp. NBC_00297 TaxID=2976005 RepID=UPI002E2BD0D4|nr:LysR family transcriptional regulator [Rhodococcus sp. NBC_00297]